MEDTKVPEPNDSEPKVRPLAEKLDQVTNREQRNGIARRYIEDERLKKALGM